MLQFLMQSEKFLEIRQKKKEKFSGSFWEVFWLHPLTPHEVPQMFCQIKGLMKKQVVVSFIWVASVIAKLCMY